MCSLKFCCLMLYIFLAKCQQVFTILAYYYFVNCLVCRLSLDLRSVYGLSYTSHGMQDVFGCEPCFLPAVVVCLLEPLWSSSKVSPCPVSTDNATEKYPTRPSGGHNQLIQHILPSSEKSTDLDTF